MEYTTFVVAATARGVASAAFAWRHATLSAPGRPSLSLLMFTHIVVVVVVVVVVVAVGDVTLRSPPVPPIPLQVIVDSARDHSTP